MGLPNFQYYYLACNVRALSFWGQDFEPNDQPAWLQIEQASSHPTSPGALLFSSLPMPSEFVNTNPVVRQSLKIWTKIRQHFGWHGNSLLAPLCANHHFHPTLLDSSFQLWTRNGIIKMKDLHINGMFPSFKLLRNKFSLPQTHFFRFLQIRICIRSNTSTFPSAPNSTQMESLSSVDPSSRGVIWYIYNCMSNQLDISLDFLKSAWEEDLGICLMEELWIWAQEGF